MPCTALKNMNPYSDTTLFGLVVGNSTERLWFLGLSFPVNETKPVCRVFFFFLKNKQHRAPSHLCHRPSCPWGPSPGSLEQCPGSWGGPTLAQCPPRRRPLQSRQPSQAGRSGPCPLVRFRWPTGAVGMIGGGWEREIATVLKSWLGFWTSSWSSEPPMQSSAILPSAHPINQNKLINNKIANHSVEPSNNSNLKQSSDAEYVPNTKLYRNNSWKLNKHLKIWQLLSKNGQI